MHNHNNNDGHKSMMWMMVLCCLLPIIFILFAGKVSFGGGSNWLIIGAIAAFIGIHFWFMRKKGCHGGDEKKLEDTETTNTPQGIEEKSELKKQDEHSGHKGSCCH